MAHYERFNTSVAKNNDDSTDEKVNLVVSRDQDESLHRHALITLNIISIFVSIISGSITFFLALEDRSMSGLSFAIDTITDVFSFAIIIWRCTTSNKHLEREIIVLRILAGIFLISGLAALVYSILDFLHREHPIHNRYLIVAVSIEAAIFICIAIGKFVVSRKLQMISAYSDAFNTLIGAFMAFSVALSNIVSNHNPEVWYIDAILGIIFSLLIMSYGLWMFVKSYQIR